MADTPDCIGPVELSEARALDLWEYLHAHREDIKADIDDFGDLKKLYDYFITEVIGDDV